MNAVTTVVKPRRGWWIALGVLAGLLLLATLAAVAAMHWIGDWSAWGPVRLVIDGDEIWSFDPSALGVTDPVLLVVGLVIALLAVVVVVPLALAIAFVAIAVGLVVGLGLPLLLAVLITGALLSPFVLLVWLGIWVVRQATGSRPANIA
jgi:hypothetical protein